MDNWSLCTNCNYSRESLLQTPCCSSSFCHSCLSSVAHCFHCNRVFDIASCSELIPLQNMCSTVLVSCKFPDCTYKSTDLMIGQHEASCKKNKIFDNPLVQTLEPTLTPSSIALQRRKNVFTNFAMYSNVRHIMECMENNLSLNDTPLTAGSDGDGFYTHIILEGDTLPGLAIKYKVSPTQIKEANRLYSDRIHERTALRIPQTSSPTFSESEAEGLERILVMRLVSRFRRKTSIDSTTEALYYLENANMNITKAFDDWAEDNSWEQLSPPFTSCMPVHEEIDLFNTKTQRRCCSLVF